VNSSYGESYARKNSEVATFDPGVPANALQRLEPDGDFEWAEWGQPEA
jgi:hypothetical protein